MRRLAIAAAMSIALGGAAFAEQGDQASSGMGAVGGEPRSTQELRSAALRMQMDWGIRYSGDADRDFAASMVRYHEGAIAIARVQVGHGSDPEMRRLAEEMIRARQSEVELLRGYLARTVRLD